MTTLKSQMSGFVSTDPGSKKTLFFLLTVLAGIVILFPHLDYQPHLAPGDHGRDLYSFKKTFEGGIPYRDFSTLNGPLMPYYYSLFYGLFGASMTSTLLGYNVCILTAGLLVFLICGLYLDPLLSFGAALWYWGIRGSEFFYTYNHIGGVVMMLAAAYSLLRYIKEGDVKFIYSGFFSLAFLLLIRPTIGLSAMAAFVIFLAIRTVTCGHKKYGVVVLKYLFCAAGVTTGVVFLYSLAAGGDPHAAGAVELPYQRYLNTDEMADGMIALYQLTRNYLFSNMIQTALSIIFILAAVNMLFKLLDRSKEKDLKIQLLTFLGFIAVMAVFNLGELLTTGIWFYALWNLSLLTILIYYAIGTGLCHLKRLPKVLTVALLLLLPLISVLRQSTYLAWIKQPQNELWIGKNRIYLSPTERPLIATLTNATLFLADRLEQDEKFLAVPYDPIYYFLTGHDSITRHLFLLNLPEAKEKDVMTGFENDHVRYILVSNRAYRDSDPRFGVLGRDYGKNLQKYIDEHFREVAVFGPWDAPAGWTANHAVKIYRRK